MSTKTCKLAGLSAALLLSGCNATLPNHHEFNAVSPRVMINEAVHTEQSDGAIYRTGTDLSLFEDRTARRIGDIVRVQLVETTVASKQANTEFDKDSNTSIANPTLFGQPFRGPPGLTSYNLETAISGQRDFTGEGSSDQSNSLFGDISAVVTYVYPNGNLQIRGEKMLTLNQGNEFVQISGVVRPDDIRINNTVLSTEVADARITYAGTGALADANAPGWLSRFFNSPWFPF